jgi:subtilisin family serine protease
VLVAMLDNGYRKNHQAFDSIRVQGRLVDERDFVTGADTVSWDAHGTGCWSLAGGFVPGQLIGPAYGADWALYHTEDMSQEMPVEEDNWAAALQRADSLGADVASSSLGYLDFDDPSLSYAYPDMDGNTAISTLAARHAAALGIVVCNAMSNSGPSLGTLGAPADADSIISVGATDSLGVIASYSSRGPSYDGRPKPEVCAQGSQTWWATWFGTATYGRASGTSCATPLVAGACALVLEAHPDWTPLQVREALMMTASRAAAPDSNTYGWGVIDAWAAINYSGSGVVRGREPRPAPGGMLVCCYPNPMKGRALIRFRLAHPGRVSFSVYDVSGRLVFQAPDLSGAGGENLITWEGRDSRGRPAGNGIYIFRVQGEARSGTARAALIR